MTNKILLFTENAGKAPQFIDGDVDCPNCGKRIKKSLSTRTHVCDCGIPVLDRDYAASLNILKKATQGHWGSWSDEMLDLNAWGDRASILVGSNTCQGKLSQ